MRRTYHKYQGYRGRSTVTDKLRVVAVVLFILVLLAAACLFFGQEYIFYTSDGLHVELPFLKERESGSNSISKLDIDLLVEESERQVQLPSGISSHAKSRLQLVDPADIVEVDGSLQTEPVEDDVLRAVSLPIEALQTGTLIQQARELGANAVILDMKTDQGELNFVTEQILGQQCGGSSRNAWINGQLEQAAQSTYLIARVSCFRDQLLAQGPAYAIETASGQPWTDSQGGCWVSAGNLNVRNYLVGVLVELAQLGFDEIVLDNWGFPAQEDGDLDTIQREEIYDSGSLSSTVTAFLKQAQSALDQYGVRLSLAVPQSLVEGSSNGGGQSFSQLQSVSGRLWVERDSAERLRARAPQASLVEIVEEFQEADAASQGIY